MEYNLKKRGFTLIELLAVIVIIAVIALIVVPQIMNIIYRVRLSAAVDSGYGMVSAAEDYVADYFLLHNGDELDRNIEFICDGKSCLNELDDELKYKGSKATAGKVIIENGKRTSLDNVVINGFTCNKKLDEDIVVCEMIEPEKPLVDDNPGIICGDTLEEEYDTMEVCYIKSVEDYIGFMNLVNSGKNFKDKKVYLMKDLDLKGQEIQPIGNLSTSFSGTFEGNTYTLSNIEINSTVEYTGMFGYNQGTIQGLKIENLTVNGLTHTGGITGYNKGIISDIMMNKVTVNGDNYVAGVVGEQDTGGVTKDIILNDINIVGTSSYIGGLVGRSYRGTVSGIVSNSKINGTGNVDCLLGYNWSGSNQLKGYCSSSNTINDVESTSPSLKGDDYVNIYNPYIDTWLGGDDDGNGYYYDYGKDGNLEIKKVSDNPMTFKLKGSGTSDDPYKIGSVDEWKQATLKSNQVDIYFELTDDIDFSGQKFYAMTTGSQAFVGELDGNVHKLSNIEISSVVEYTGIFGYNKGTIKGLEIENLTVNGLKHTGGITGYNKGIISDIVMNNVTVNGDNNVAGVVGEQDTGGVTKDIILNDINILGTSSYIGGLVGRSYQGTVSGIVNNSKINGTSDVGCLLGYNLSGSNQLKGYCSSSNTINDKASTSPSLKGDDYVNIYNPYIDTWISGDDDENGYYYDYGKDGNLEIKKVSDNPMTFNLKGEGTKENPYEIGSVDEWKQATLKSNQADIYFELTDDIDFNGQKFYILTTGSAPFIGTFEGNAHKLSNINISSVVEYTGIFGYNQGTIKGLEIENLTVNGLAHTGGITGYNKGIISDIMMNKVTVNGDYYVAGVVGEQDTGGVTKDIILNGINILGTSSNIGGLVGRSYRGTVSGIVSNSKINGTSSVECLLGYNLSGSNQLKGYCSPDSIINNNPKGGNQIAKSEYSQYINFCSVGDTDSNGYCFEYDSNNDEITIKKV